MELLILGGLALVVLLAATADRDEPEVETVIITRPAPRRAMNPLAPLAAVLAMILLGTILLNRLFW